MSKQVANKLQNYVLNTRYHSLTGAVKLIKNDLESVLASYMRLDGDIGITAELDDISGDLIFKISCRAKEVYEIGGML